MAFNLKEQARIKYQTFQSFDEDGILENMESGPVRETVSLLTEKEKTQLEDVPESHMSMSNLFSSISTLRALSGKEKVKGNKVKGIIFPWSAKYKAWWWLTVMGAAVTTFFETFQIAFASAALSYPFTGRHYIIEYILAILFFTDIIANFNLAYYNSRDEVVFERKAIARNYLSGKFWIDFVAFFPFQFVALIVTDQLGEETEFTQYLLLFRLLRLLRTYRISDFFEILQFDTRISLFGLTMIRNFAAALVWTHMAACMLYFISRRSFLNGYETFLGEDFEELDEFESYVTSLYWSIVTFATVGYGDFAAANSAERIWAMFYMLSNIVIQAWIIGSITLLLIKKDEKTGNYRDTLETLDQYSQIHSFDQEFHRRLKTQLQLDFNTREIADESVLKFFPASMRRKVLRRLYTPFLANTELMNGVRQQFVDAFLSSCCVEIFSPGEEILRRNAISSDLYLLVGGIIRYAPNSSSHSTVNDNEDLQQKAGDFINEVGFFTESPQIDTVTTVTVCKTLTISRSAYKLLAQDHPGSSGKILQNLLDKVRDMEAAFGAPVKSNIPVALGYLRAGSSYFHRNDSLPEFRRSDSFRESGQHNSASALTAIKELVKMHIEKQKDDHTTRFLFAASRGDSNTISVMCDQGFDPDCSDYDSRTGMYHRVFAKFSYSAFTHILPQL
jgi:CRP-like cAMP-binding protein